MMAGGAPALQSAHAAQISPETTQRKNTISIAGMRSSCFKKTFMTAKANVARSMFATPRLSGHELAREAVSAG